MRKRSPKYEYFEKLHPREPYFVLRAQDQLAPELIETWAIEAELNGCPPDKVAEARWIANAMRRWSGRKKMPD